MMFFKKKKKYIYIEREAKHCLGWQASPTTRRKGAHTSRISRLLQCLPAEDWCKKAVSKSGESKAQWLFQLQAKHSQVLACFQNICHENRHQNFGPHIAMILLHTILCPYLVTELSVRSTILESTEKESLKNFHICMWVCNTLRCHDTHITLSN